MNRGAVRCLNVDARRKTISLVFSRNFLWEKSESDPSHSNQEKVNFPSSGGRKGINNGNKIHPQKEPDNVKRLNIDS